MTTVSDQYRQMAERARSEAALATLSNVKRLHLQSAERFDHIAQGLEGVSEAKARNDAAKEAEARSLRAVQY